MATSSVTSPSILAPAVSDSGLTSTPVNAPKPSSSIDKNALLFPCYVCQKNFSIGKIFEHEAECLRSWEMENDKLPVHERKPHHPVNPSDVRLASLGQAQAGPVDYIGSLNKKWEENLDLVSCEKCQRKFFPKGLEYHVTVCTGPAEENKREATECSIDKKHHQMRYRSKSARH